MSIEQTLTEYLKNMCIKLINSGYFKIYTNTDNLVYNNLDDLDNINRISIWVSNKFIMEINIIDNNTFNINLDYETIDGHHCIDEYNNFANIHNFTEALEYICNNDDFVKYCGINTINRLRECFIG